MPLPAGSSASTQKAEPSMPQVGLPSMPASRHSLPPSQGASSVSSSTMEPRSSPATLTTAHASDADGVAGSSRLLLRMAMSQGQLTSRSTWRRSRCARRAARRSTARRPRPGRGAAGMVTPVVAAGGMLAEDRRPSWPCRGRDCTTTTSYPAAMSTAFFVPRVHRPAVRPAMPAGCSGTVSMTTSASTSCQPANQNSRPPQPSQAVVACAGVASVPM